MEDSSAPATQNSKFSKFKSLTRNQKIILGLIGLLLVSVVVSAFIFKKNIKTGINSGSLSKQSENGPAGGSVIETKTPQNAIAKAGDEYIYKHDLEVELANYPGPKTDKTNKTVLDKLVKDSIVLQAAKKSNLITLDPGVFNLEQKNYGKRFEDLKNIQTKIDSSVDQISGTMISVWFYNMFPAKIGLEKGKQEALKRITNLHQRVVSKEITMEQAGDIIKKDSSYGDLDFGYTVNAIVPFSQLKGKRITFDKDFDSLLWKTSPGAITDVFLGKTINEYSNQETEAYYIFARVDKKIDTGNSETFSKWYDDQKGKYEVTYY